MADVPIEPIPAGHDLVMLANVVHILSPERNRALLRRAREYVMAGARLLLIELPRQQFVTSIGPAKQLRRIDPILNRWTRW